MASSEIERQCKTVIVGDGAIGKVTVRTADLFAAVNLTRLLLADLPLGLADWDLLSQLGRSSL